MPYRLLRLARTAHELLRHLRIAKVDVLGVRWGGALAQEFVHQYPTAVRRLVLAATSVGVAMVPGGPRRCSASSARGDTSIRLHGPGRR